LEKLGFPWILSTEMSLFNGLRTNFAETFIRAPYAPQGSEGRRARPSVVINNAFELVFSRAYFLHAYDSSIDF
jgi:hypothetical protein